MWDVAILAAAVGGFFGVAGGVLGPLVREWYINKRERESLAAAFVQEIAGVLEIVDRRGYIKGLRKTLAAQKADAVNIHWYTFTIVRDPFAVYSANIARLGILPVPFLRKVVRFYTMGTSILADIADMNAMESRQSYPARDERVERLEELIALFEEVEGLGREIAGPRPTGGG